VRLFGFFLHPTAASGHLPLATLASRAHADRMKIAALSLILLSCTPWLRAEEPQKPDPPEAWMDPANVDDEDFAIQGEYSGEFDGKKFGVQIWAQGGGKFEAVTYHGGLPGDGWDGETETISRIPGERAADSKTAFFESEKIRATVDGRSAQVMNEKQDRVYELLRAHRESSTLGTKPPEGAIVLFDGKENNHFPGSKVTEDGLLEQGATSSDKFGDATLHVEFMLSYMPAARGQGRSNSGVYVQGRYEVQVLDSFALEGRNNECGGIYSMHAPKVNMCYPPLTWQTYDIDFTAAKYDADGKKTSDAKMTVKHNGVLIQEDAEIPQTTPSAPVKEENSPGPLYLQEHHNQVRYRNIWLLPHS
jgi:3-keto-disaccharide hydrolase